ncbi:MAG: glycosyltransferase family 4 protein [Candidatus Zixiibacteriota bacterium]|jgi:UDP-glucose:(heptosyl)LPS alpha-1,3-glucosyltransferase
MKLALVCEDVHKRGGTERVVYELATRLAPRHDVHVFAATAEGIEGAGVTWHRVPVPDLPTLVRVPAFALLSTLMIKRMKFDAVIGQGINTLGADYMVVHTVNAGRRAIFHKLVRNGVRLGPARRAGEEAWYALACAVEKRLLRGRRPEIISVSSGTSRELSAYYPRVERERLNVVYNGVDCGEFNDTGRDEARTALRDSLGLAADDRVVLFVGGLWWLKGLSHAIEAVRFLPSRYHLVIAGKGPDATYRARAEDVGVGRRVHFLGSRKDVAAIYRGADVFVLPSYYEAFSLVTLEAMASGLPVLLSRVNGADDCLCEGFNGFAVERDGRDIAAKVELVFEDEKRRHSMERGARATACRFTWDRAAAAFERVIATGRPAVSARARVEPGEFTYDVF